jgi:hypothetical protein
MQMMSTTAMNVWTPGSIESIRILSDHAIAGTESMEMMSDRLRDALDAHEEVGAIMRESMGGEELSSEWEAEFAELMGEGGTPPEPVDSYLPPALDELNSGDPEGVEIPTAPTTEPHHVEQPDVDRRFSADGGPGAVGSSGGGAARVREAVPG